MDTPSPNRVTFHGYILVDVSQKPPAVVKPTAVHHSRQEGNAAKQWREDADSLRVRRARITIYES